MFGSVDVASTLVSSQVLSVADSSRVLCHRASKVEQDDTTHAIVSVLLQWHI